MRETRGGQGPLWRGGKQRAPDGRGQYERRWRQHRRRRERREGTGRVHAIVRATIAALIVGLEQEWRGATPADLEPRRGLRRHETRRHDDARREREQEHAEHEAWTGPQQ